MNNTIPILDSAIAAKYERGIIQSVTDGLYLLFSDHAAALISTSGKPEAGNTVVLATGDEKVIIGTYRRKNGKISVEDLFDHNKIDYAESEENSHVRWIFPVLKIKIFCVKKIDSSN